MWAVIFVWGCLSSFVGSPSSFVGNSRVWWWGVIGWWWCQVVCVMVVMSSSGCHVASCDVAPLVGVNEEAGRGVVLLTWAGHNLAADIVVVALWWALNGGGGWVVSLMVVVGRKKQQHGNV